jgi:pimeloyl-ACP methyl ester carboxylesterase
MPTAAGFYYFAHQAEDVSRPPVILIHGAGGNHLSWPPQVRRMDDQRVFAPDLPGHGKSEGVGRHSIQEYADDVLRFMDALELREAALAGHSMGSAIALWLALHCAERVSALVLIGGGAKLRVAPSILDSAGKPETFETAVVTINENSFSRNASPRVKELAAKRMMETRPSVLLGDLLACNEFDVLDQLEKVGAPALIVCGSEDRMTPPKYSEFLHKGITGSQMHIVEGAGHMAMLEKPDVIADLLSRFLDDLPPRA